MPNPTEKNRYQHRKEEHLSLAQKYWRNQKHDNTAGFGDLRLIPNSLPEISLDEVDLSVQLLNHRFEKPFFIEAMTGGFVRGDKINAQLAEIAKNQHLAMAVGSQTIALKFPELAAGFRKVRETNPDGFILANIGASHGLEDAKRAVDMIQANALEVHINVIQELAMKAEEGDRSFYWLDNINEIAGKLDVPVIVKEVGFGMSQQTFKQLEKTAVSAINIGGRGGTNFAWIEEQRSNDFSLYLDEQGFTAVESLLEAKFSNSTKPLIATGGIQYASQIVKSLVLGASLVSSAGFILSNLLENGPEFVEMLLENWELDIRKFYTMQGAKNLTELQQSKLILQDNLLDFYKQRNIKIEQNFS
ncbi:MAG TPA: type 2 isopentenyl-diphosphate Delta-isomerase [Lactovum miscens]|uniref:type 2 isopentenyl-diphosphate Delta-isomerase n=1 Tax=Lactovum miscens TaxID=190387 RepID=UPI002ED87409